MNKGKLMNDISRKLNRVGFKLKKHSPEILVVSGVVGVVTSGVMACKATTKLSGILDETRGTVEKIEEVAANPDMVSEEYTEEDAKKDKVIVYSQTTLKVAKLYAPSIIIGGLSIGAILTGSNIFRKRNMALAAAYATIDKSFKEYRGRVVERFGEDMDRELKYNVKTKEIKEQVEDENGKKKTVKTKIDVVDPNQISEFAVMFDDGCNGWTKDPESNKVFLIHQQNYANERLQRKGHLFLNEVYDMLGCPRTKAGQMVGWIYDEKNPHGDNFVDFGIFNANREANRDFVNGYERTILLDFNVDGNILNDM